MQQHNRLARAPRPGGVVVKPRSRYLDELSSHSDAWQGGSALAGKVPIQTVLPLAHDL
jgi:hypothetical protein